MEEGKKNEKRREKREKWKKERGMKKEKKIIFREQRGGNMTSEDRRLIVETLGEMRELKGEMKGFKEQVIERVQKLEKREAERGKERMTVFSLLISSAALAVSIIVNFFKGKV